MADAESRPLRVSSGDLPFVDALEDPEGNCRAEDRPRSRRSSQQQLLSDHSGRSSRRASRSDGRPPSRRPSRSPVPSDDARTRSRRSSRADDEPRIRSRRSSSRGIITLDANSADDRPPSRRPSRTPIPTLDVELVEDRPPSRRPSRTPIPTLDVDSGGDRPPSRRPSRTPLPGGLDVDSGDRPPSRRPSRTPLPVGLDVEESESDASRIFSRKTSSAPRSRRGSHNLLNVVYDGGRRKSSSSRRGSHAIDLAEVVLAELSRPSRRSSRAIASHLGDIVSIEVRRESHGGSGGSSVEEVRAQVRRQSLASSSGRRRSLRPSLLTQRGSRGGASSEDDGYSREGDEGGEDEDEEYDDEEEYDDDGASTSYATSRIPQYVCAIVVNLAAFCNGVVFGWPAVALPRLESSTSPIEGGSLGSEAASWLVATICISAALSTPLWVAFNDRYGRKTSGYLMGLCFGLHWIVLGVTKNLVCLFTARAIGGLGTAGSFVVCPIYVKEISEDSIRGELGIVFSIMFNLGVLVAYSVGAAVSYKGVNILGMSFVLLFILALWQIPESPVHLVSQGETMSAARSLQWLRGKGADILDELTVLRRANKRRRAEGDATLFELLSDRASFKGLLITTVLCTNQALCGFVVVLSYTVNIFREAGDSISPYTATIIVGFLLLISSYGASHLVDRAGRKIMILVSNGGISICLVSLGLYFYIKHIGINVESLHLGWLPVTSLSLFMVFVSLGVIPLPFVLMTEIFLPQVQKLATTIGFFIIFSLSFVSIKFFTNIADAIGIFSCYWIFAAICVLTCIFTQIYIPETKGRSLESILDELSGEKKPMLVIEEKQRNNYRV